MSCKDRSVVLQKGKVIGSVFLAATSHHQSPSRGAWRTRGSAFYRWGASLRIQPPLIHSRYYVRNAKRQVVAGVNERRLYLQASREPERGKNLTLLILPGYHARIPIVTFLILSLYPPPPPHTHTHRWALVASCFSGVRRRGPWTVY